MCGIAGYVGQAVAGVIDRMTRALAHRGPDACGTWHDVDDRVHFGHRRLSILDHSGGAQPMVSGDERLVVVFNGAIYNAAELRTELEGRGHRFKTARSDTEVLLHGYREWGSALPLKLNGMWAFVLYDRDRAQLFGSRDRFGEKPLFYVHCSGTLAFASELAALRCHPATPTTLSRTALKKYFGYGYIPAPHCLLEGVRQLPAGHSFSYHLASDRLELERYWEFVLEPREDRPVDPIATWGEELRARLSRAVHRRLTADVPVGVLLSGGIDSSAIAAFAAQHVPPGELATFAMGFTERSFDETSWALTVARHLRTNHRAEVLSPDEAGTILPEVVARLDQPLGDPSLLPTFLLSRFARRHVTVALGGDGGDELFAGYDPFRALGPARQYARWVPKRIHAAIRYVVAKLPVSHRHLSLEFKLKRTLRGLDYPAQLWLPVWMSPLDPDELAGLLEEPVDIEEVYAEAIESWDRCVQPDPVDQTIQFFTRLYFASDVLVKLDRASMMNGLECRSPFLDNDVVEFARRLPSAWKLRHGETKFLLKRALAPLLPRPVLHRAKHGFGVPVSRWFRDETLVLDSASLPPGVSHAFAHRAVRSHTTGAADHSAFLWSAFVLGGWCSPPPLSFHA
ncbi:MAG: asparagine synthase (glutamine-hydrolyzing) [Opitutaceae bacterium]|nr:asparagine synthase (glutamine-hydrolyzing) [Opitutaceae bacterium]